MKRIAFAWVTFMYDFDTKEEALAYVKNNRWNHKGWYFEVINKNAEDFYEKLISYDGEIYTVKVCKRYQDYNPGW